MRNIKRINALRNRRTIKLDKLGYTSGTCAAQKEIFSTISVIIAIAVARVNFY